MRFVDEKYFKAVDDNILFVGPYMEAYIPSFYFTGGKAQEVGDNIKTLGLFNIRTFEDAEGKKPNPLRLFNVPAQLMTYPTSYDAANLDLHNNGENEIYVVLKYYQNDIFCPRAIPKSIHAFESFLAVLTAGKIPASVSYDDVFDIWMKNMDVADQSYDVSDTMYELVISEIYRSRQNPVDRFGSVLGKNPKHSPLDYKTASPRDITKINSNFTGITFENVDEMLTASVNRTQTGKAENVSPMEKIIKY